LIDGQCQLCPQYERARPGGTSCGPELCPDRSSYVITELGLCRQCPPGQTTADSRTCGAVAPVGQSCRWDEVWDGSRCVRNRFSASVVNVKEDKEDAVLDCGPDRVLDRATNQCRSCDAYQRPVDGHCQEPACRPGEVITRAGGCYACPGDQTPAPGGRECRSQSTCGPREQWLNGSCVPCPEWTRAQDSFSRCAADRCPARNKTDRDGRCAPCPDYAIPVEPDRRDCETVRCSASAPLATLDGRCVSSCPSPQIPDRRRSKYCTIGGVRRIQPSLSTSDETSTELVGAASPNVSFIDEQAAGEFFTQEKQALTFLQNP